MVFKDLEEIIHRQYSKAHSEHKKIATLCCQYCDLPIDYFRSPPPEYNPPKQETKLRSQSRSPSSPRYSPTSPKRSESSSTDDIPPPPKMPKPSTHVALLNLNEGEILDDLKLQHLDIRKILKTTDTGGTRELQLA